MINITEQNKSQCCGCNACGDACAKHAITFKTDIEGFWYPEVNKDLCTDCGLCEKVCPIAAFDLAEAERLQTLDVLHEGNIKPTDSPPQVFAVHHNDENTWQSSSSGGVFAALSDYVISQGGYVFGAAYDAENNVCHECVSTKADALKFRGSKYVQSDMSSIYKQVKTAMGGVKLSFSLAHRARLLPSSSF